MKLQIYGCEPERQYRGLRLLGGGYDFKLARVVLIVQDDDNNPGTLMLEVSEGRELEDILGGLPLVQRVESTTDEINPPSSITNGVISRAKQP